MTITITFQLSWINESNNNNARIEFKYPAIFYKLFYSRSFCTNKKSIRYANVKQYLSQTSSIVALLSLHYNVPDISSRIITTFLKILEWRTAEYCYSFFGPLKIRRKRIKASALIWLLLLLRGNSFDIPLFSFISNFLKLISIQAHSLLSSSRS